MLSYEWIGVHFCRFYVVEVSVVLLLLEIGVVVT